MEKAYDLKDLGNKLKEAGLPILADAAEETAAKAYHAFKEWIKESAVLSDNKIDDVLAPFVDNLDAVVLPQIDRINGREG